MKRLPKTERQALTALQFLHSIASSGLDIADRLSPPSEAHVLPYGSPAATARSCRGLARSARDAFYAATGLFVTEVSMTELSTVNPSPRVIEGIRKRIP